MNKEEIEPIEEPVVKIEPIEEPIVKIEPKFKKETKKKFDVVLVTNTSIIYKDKESLSFCPIKGHENIKIGDILKI